MSDARLRDLERQAMTGDRSAMARLLAEEARAGRAHPRAACIARGFHRWTTAVTRCSALSTLVGWSLCVDCRLSEIEAKERALDAAPPEFVALRGHIGLSLRVGPGTNSPRGRLVVRALCGYDVETFRAESMEAWSNAADRPSCGSCDRARPERKQEARAAAPGLHGELLGLVSSWVLPASLVREVPIIDAPPSRWIDGSWQEDPLAVAGARYDLDEPESDDAGDGP